MNMPNISCCTRPQMFTSFARLKKSSASLNFFFQSKANDDVKVNKTQRSSTKIHSGPGSMSEF